MKLQQRIDDIVKSLEFREFTAIEKIGYQKKSDIVKIIE